MTPEELQKKINEQNQVISSRYIEPTQADLESGIVRPAPTPVPSVSGLDATPPLKATPQEAETSTVISRVKDLNEALVGQSAYRATQETAQGIPELQKTQTDISAQLKAIQNEAQQIPLQLQQEATGRGITVGGLQPLQTARLRTNAIQALGVSSLLEASRGNLALATTLVDKAVAAKYDPIKEEIAAKTANLDLILKDPSTTLAEKNRAQAQKDIQDKKAQDLETQKEEQKNIYAIALEAAKNGADALTLQKIQGSKTAQEAITNAGTSLQKKVSTETTLTERDRAIYQDIIGKLNLSKGADGYVNTAVYARLKEQYPDIFKSLVNPKELLNPNDPTAQKYLEEQTSGEENSADISDMSKELSGVKGADGYISPENWKKALDAWVGAGKSTASFITNFRNYANPTGQYVGI